MEPPSVVFSRFSALFAARAAVAGAFAQDPKFVGNVGLSARTARGAAPRGEDSAGHSGTPKAYNLRIGSQKTGRLVGRAYAARPPFIQ